MLSDFTPSLLDTRAGEVDVVSQLAEFERNGFVRVGNVLTPAGCLGREVCEQIMDGDRQYDGLFFQHDSASGRYEDLEYARLRVCRALTEKQRVWSETLCFGPD